MATVILGIAGAAIGGAVAGPGGAARGAMLGWSIGSTVGGMVDASRMRYPAQETGKLTDLAVSTSSYGTFIPWVWGAGRVPAQIMWATDLVQHQDKTSSGGKGMPKQETITDTYTVSFAALLCMGGRMTNQSLKKIHFDDTIVFDKAQDPKLNKVTPRFYIGDFSQNADPLMTAAYGDDAPAFRGRCYLMFQDLLLTDYGNRIPNISVELETEEVYLADVVRDLAPQVSIPLDRLDLTDGEGPDPSRKVTGMMILTRSSVRDSIQALLSALQTDLIDVDGVLRLVRRGGAPVRTIYRIQQGAEKLESGFPEAQNRMSEKRAQEVELPKRIDYNYYSQTNSFQQANQGAVRQSAHSDNQISISSPLVLSDDEARRIAEQELYLPWLERYTYTTTLLPSQLELCVADPLILEVDDQGTIERVRVVDCEAALPGTVTITMVRDDGALEDQNVVGVSPPESTQLVPPVLSQFVAWSGLEIQDQDTSDPGFYVSASGLSGWRGCTIYYSADSGANWIAGGRCGTKGLFGVTSSALPLAQNLNSNGFDTTNTLELIPQIYGELDTTSEETVLAGGGNYALVYGSSSYELLGFASVVPLSGGDYQVSDMLRRQRATSDSGHQSGDTFVILDASVVRVSVNTNLIGQTILVKCVSPYTDIDDAQAQNVTISTPSYLFPTKGQIQESLQSARTPYWVHRGSYLVNDSSASGGTYPDSSMFPDTSPLIRRSADGPSGGYAHTYPYGTSWIQMQISNSNPSSSRGVTRLIASDGADASRGVIEIRNALQGSISASGTSVSGTGTDFTVFSGGDYICVPSQGLTVQCCEVQSVQSATSLTLVQSAPGFNSNTFYRGYQIWNTTDSDDGVKDLSLNLPDSDLFVLHVFHYRNGGMHDNFFYVMTDLLDLDGVSFVEPEYYKTK